MRYKALIDYFYFSRTERLAAVRFLVAGLVIYFGGQLMGHYYRPPTFDYDRYAAELATWRARQPSTTVPVVALPDQPFDPNTWTAADWQRLGIGERAARGIITYRDKSGGFRRKTDVAKLYAVSDSLYAQLAPYIELPEAAPTQQIVVAQTGRLFPFDPNIASAAELRALGLSERIANNIVKYRNKGGFFVKPADFEKIYGITPAQFERLRPYLRLPESSQQGVLRTANTELFPFDPNTASEEELKRLGLPGRVAKGLIKYRNAGAVFRRPDDVANVYGVGDSLYTRIAPYIEIAEESALPTPAAVEVELRLFDPNTATKAELIALGLSPLVAHGIMRYREAGGHFRDAAAFGRLRSIPTEQFERLAPYIQITTSPEVAPEVIEVLVDINAATAEDWQRLRGIGPAYTRRILEQRERMGGFGSWEMLRRTPGLPDSVYQRIRPLLQLEAPPATAIYINRIDEAALVAHPYLTKSQALSLLEFRADEGGTIKNYKRLQKARVSERVLEKIRPLLYFDP